MTSKIKEGLGDLAHVAEKDHEVQMACADLYKIAKYAIKLHDMLKGITEVEGLEGWQQSKITKAADYIGSVYHALDYDLKFNEGYTPTKDKEDYQAKKKALQDIQNDPETAKDPELKAELISRLVLGNKVFDHELIYGLSPNPLESVAVFEVKNDLISTAWFYFP